MHILWDHNSMCCCKCGSIYSRKRYGLLQKRLLEESARLLSDIPITFGTWTILLANTVPISMAVTIAISRLFQGYLAQTHHTTATALLADGGAGQGQGYQSQATSPRVPGGVEDSPNPRPGSSLLVRNSNVNDELGLIKYVFCDKTGTLTQNQMLFKRCCVGLDTYGDSSFGMSGADGYQSSSSGASDAEEPQKMLQTRVWKQASTGQHVSVSLTKTKTTTTSGGRPRRVRRSTCDMRPYVGMYNQSLRSKIRMLDRESVEFMLNLAINCTVFIEEDEENPADFVVYSASSPDEGALVNTAAVYGVELYRREPAVAKLRINWNAVEATSAPPAPTSAGAPETAASRAGANDGHIGTTFLSVEVLGRHDFTSERKRSSVVCRFADPCEPSSPTGCSRMRTVCFIKGSDEALNNLCGNDEATGARGANVFCNVDKYAEDGLRTLCMAIKELDEEAMQRWHMCYKAALETQDEEMMQTAAAMAEQDCKMQGCTGIEDRLQVGVRETIAALSAAGMKVWILTGDKMATAKNVAYQAGVLRSISDLCTIGENDNPVEDVRKALESIDNQDRTPGELVLCIDSRHLNTVLIRCKLEFARLAAAARSTICCRATPQQKAEMVRLMRLFDKKPTLAVGDGGNDCGMILDADVGVAVMGKEGNDALNVSDFAIANFSLLQTLVLVYGHRWYRAQTTMLLLSIYRGVIVSAPQLFYGFSSLFTGQKLFYEVCRLSYMGAWTGLTLIALGALDSHVDIHHCLRDPSAYRATSDGKTFSGRIVLKYVALGLLHAAICYFWPYYFIGGGSVAVANSDGVPLDAGTVGVCCFLGIVMVANGKTMIESYTASNFILAVGAASLAFFLVFLSFVSHFSFSVSPELCTTLERFFKTPACFLVALQVFAWCTGVDYMIDLYSRATAPTTRKGVEAGGQNREAPAYLRNQSSSGPSRHIPGTLTRNYNPAFAFTGPELAATRRHSYGRAYTYPPPV
eukprot:GHVU01216948.1.p1 GENE.GHVU01216948.1~~GHVU01216948.1.p1  ORF type:complete len:977 (+),score=103.85 GHVU01216948.1:1599-4529(+)